MTKNLYKNPEFIFSLIKIFNSNSIFRDLFDLYVQNQHVQSKILANFVKYLLLNDQEIEKYQQKMKNLYDFNPEKSKISKIPNKQFFQLTTINYLKYLLKLFKNIPEQLDQNLNKIPQFCLKNLKNCGKKGEKKQI